MQLAAEFQLLDFKLKLLIIVLVLIIFLAVSLVFYIVAILSQRKQLKNDTTDNSKVDEFNNSRTYYEQEIGKIKKIYKQN